MKEYEDLEHMTKVELCSNIKESYYLPHHVVWREDSITTKLRVVFDASCKTTSGVSLNDILLKGPCIQEDLIHLLTRFRKHRYAMTADISKMYRRIWKCYERANSNLENGQPAIPYFLPVLQKKKNDPTLILDLSENSAKILGFRWDPSGDVFKYKVKLSEKKTIVTKRQILSEIATIFDPLGLISSDVIKAKIKMQCFWAIGIGWNETLPEEIMLDWYKFRESLLLLNNLSIPRCIVITEEIIDVQIHGFSDASIEAFGAFVLLAHLADKIIAKLKMNISQGIFWTDFSIVFTWISSPSAQWKTFVAHSVGEIQEITSTSEWAHVDTNDKPADIISRGREHQMMLSDSFWWFFQPIMGILLSQKIEPSRPFSVCGVDFAGPLMIKTNLRRNSSLSKRYICVFICFAIKAVHIELVGNLTSASFISALRIFSDRRGKCMDIYLNNSKNFVGANRQLQELSNLIHNEEHQSKL
ncbi:hypothetical protein QTP88_001556 [Uroleucon formosanum]